MTVFSIAAEGACDIEALRKILKSTGYEISREFNCRGKGNFYKKLINYANAAQHSDWLILRDLDRDADCPRSLLERIFPSTRPVRLIFRVAVRSLESWLMADRQIISDWMNVPVARMPSNPEALEDPKSALANIAYHSRSREIRGRMFPLQGSGARVGAEYESMVLDFIRKKWDPIRAHHNELSPSLSKLIFKLMHIN